MAASSKSFPMRLIQAVFGSRNERMLKRLQKNVAAVNAFEDALAELSDEALRAKTTEFRERFRQGETLDELLPEAFAVVRETGKRVLGMRHFDVQLIGGMVLHEGKIAEMRTGEGKTLVATLPAYLNALSGKAVHVITVNDYLARRDALWMGQIFNALDMSVGVVLGGMAHAERKRAYECAITYGTNNEFGFDYLRDNMAFHPDQRVQRDLSYAVVDEVDSILIDEARTPLIISGPTDDRSDLYTRVNALIHGSRANRSKTGPAITPSTRKRARFFSPKRVTSGSNACSRKRTCWPPARACTARPTSRSCTTSTLPSVPTRCSSATSITWSRMARS